MRGGSPWGQGEGRGSRRGLYNLPSVRARPQSSFPLTLPRFSFRILSSSLRLTNNSTTRNSTSTKTDVHYPPFLGCRVCDSLPDFFLTIVPTDKVSELLKYYLGPNEDRKVRRYESYKRIPNVGNTSGFLLSVNVSNIRPCSHKSSSLSRGL